MGTWAVLRRLGRATGRGMARGATAGKLRWRRRPRLVFGQRKRTVLVPALLGLAASAASFVWYTAALTPPTPPAVDGVGELYIDRAGVPTQLMVTFAEKEQRANRSRVKIRIVFRQMGGKPVRWALVLYRDARLVDVADSQRTFLPPGVTATAAQAGDPPFRENPRQDTQVIQGVSQPVNLAGQASSVAMAGWIPKAVFSSRGARLAVSLPRYGRLRVPPVFQFPRDPDAVDLGIAGAWRPPETFQVDVAAGDNAPGQRIDVASPDVVDPARLAWQDDESVRALLQRTDLAEESRQQTLVFVLGAVVGGGVSSLLVALEKLLVDTKARAAPASPSSLAPP
jgi:hypothetical protein